MVIICPALRISGCAQGSSELSYRQVAGRDYRVPEGIDRHSVNLHCGARARLVIRSPIRTYIHISITVYIPYVHQH